MTSNSCTIIIVPDATSQCKRYTISKSVLWGLGIFSAVAMVTVGAVLFLLLGEYNAMSIKAKQFAKLQKMSSSQRSSIERFEQDITHVSKQLAGIKQLNFRLLVLTGLDPAKTNESNDGLTGVGGSDVGLDTQFE
ncbi:MAG: hypothetical protein GY801_44290 [bacterium]|nr:hypothetical protein [bacterium]